MIPVQFPDLIVSARPTILFPISSSLSLRRPILSRRFYTYRGRGLYRQPCTGLEATIKGVLLSWRVVARV